MTASSHIPTPATAESSTPMITCTNEVKEDFDLTSFMYKATLEVAKDNIKEILGDLDYDFKMEAAIRIRKAEGALLTVEKILERRRANAATDPGEDEILSESRQLVQLYREATRHYSAVGRIKAARLRILGCHHGSEASHCTCKHAAPKTPKLEQEVSEKESGTASLEGQEAEKRKERNKKKSEKKKQKREREADMKKEQVEMVLTEEQGVSR